jgi:hypothetical protein
MRLKIKAIHLTYRSIKKKHIVWVEEFEMLFIKMEKLSLSKVFS